MEKRCWWIAVLPGDGMGVGVTRETTRVLPAIETRLRSTRFNHKEHPTDATEPFYSRTPLPNPTFDGGDDADPAFVVRASGGGNLEIVPDTKHNHGCKLVQVSMREDRLEFEMFSSAKNRELVRSDGVEPAPVVAVRDRPEPFPCLPDRGRMTDGCRDRID